MCRPWSRSPCPGLSCSPLGALQPSPAFHGPFPSRASWGPPGSLRFCCCLCPPLGQWGILVLSRTPDWATSSCPWLPLAGPLVLLGKRRSQEGEEELYCKHADQLSVNTCSCLPVVENEAQRVWGPWSHVSGWEGCYFIPPTHTLPHSGGPR